jgi:hypothetical protein
MTTSARRLRAALFTCASLGTTAAFAQTAADGYSIYQNATFKGQSIGAPACVTCHGPDPRNSVIPQILMAAGNPDFLPIAWAMVPMTQFDYAAKINTDGRAGIATYLLYPDAGTLPYSLFATQSLDFGTVVIGQTTSKTMMLTNIGAQALTGVTLQASPSATGVTQTNDCPSTLAVQASCTVTVTFAPLAAGTANAGYVLNASNDANSGNEFFVFATGATSAPPPAASGGGGGAFDGLSLGLLFLLQPVLSRRRPASRTDRAETVRGFELA